LAPLFRFSNNVRITSSRWTSHIYPTPRQSFFGQSLKR
jgi:hypothetical protein